MTAPGKFPTLDPENGGFVAFLDHRTIGGYRTVEVRCNLCGAPLADVSVTPKLGVVFSFAQKDPTSIEHQAALRADDQQGSDVDDHLVYWPKRHNYQNLPPHVGADCRNHGRVMVDTSVVREAHLKAMNRRRLVRLKVSTTP